MPDNLHDYSHTTTSDVERVTSEAISNATALVDDVAAESTSLTYTTTLGRLEAAARVVADAYGQGAFMARVHVDPDVRTAGVTAEEQLTKWGSDLVFRRDLHDVIARYASSDDAAALSGTRRRLLDHWLRDFRRAGHELSAEDRTQLQTLKNDLIELEVEFSRNLDEWDDGIEVDRDELSGMPDAYIEGLPKTEDGSYRIGLSYPEYVPFIQQSTNRDLRRRLQYKFWNRASEANMPLLARAATLRRTIAELMGYPTWADYKMEIKMAQTPKHVADFYESVVPGLTDKATTELAILQGLHEQLGETDAVQSWDWAFLHTQQKKNNFGVDQNEVAQYFSLDSVIAGMFDITGDAFGLSYQELDNSGAWHPDVKLYAISNTGESEPIAYFYADLFPREGKFSHAAAFPLVYGLEEADGTYRKPVAAIVANFTKPTETTPSLLKHSEAVTLFHEFGHILHFCLTNVDLIRFSGFDTEWDFVEAPSQIMENWMWEEDILTRFATHHETGDPIPTDLVNSLVAARDLNVGLHTVRQVFLGQVDLLMHSQDRDTDLDEVQRTGYAYTLLPYHEGTNFVASFGHLMGGYDAGYYGYLWSSVYGHDMFSEFTKEGLTDAGVGMRYRHEVLACGGSRDAIDHLRAFLGREPNSDAFLARLGLT